MPTLTWLLSVVALSIAMSATPGPNNMMVMASGATYGFARTLPHMAGIAIGFAIMMALLGLGGHALLADGRIRTVLRWAGAAYLLWLAWRIATADPIPAQERDAAPDRRRSRPFNFVEAALFQWVNPKAWVIAAGTLATYTTPGGSLTPALLLALIFGIMALPSTALWTMIGIGAAHLLHSRRALHRFNVAMAALLVLSLVPILMEA